MWKQKWLYLLLAGIADILVGVKKRADVDGLATPDMSVDSPIERQLQRPAIKGPGER